MARDILVDAGPLIALFDRDDAFHERALAFVSSSRHRFVTTTPVMTEVLHMIDFDVRAQIGFLEWVTARGVSLHEIRPTDINRVLALTRKYSDLPMDFADATLVVTAERTGIRTIASVDSDFDVYRLPGKEQIRNVFYE